MIKGEDMRIAHHEAGHVVAGLHFGRRVDFVGRGRGHGLTRYDPMVVKGDIERRAVESGVITLAPFFEDAIGCAYDLAILDGLLVAGCDGRREPDLAGGNGCVRAPALGVAWLRHHRDGPHGAFGVFMIVLYYRFRE